MATTLNAGTSTSGAAISADTTGILQLQSGSTPTTAVTIDASQNVGVGTTSPRAKVDVNGSIYTQWADTNFIGMQFGSDPSGYRLGLLPVSSTRDLQIQAKSADAYSVSGITFYTGTGPTERMRIDSSGNLLVGTTSQANGCKVSLQYGGTVSWGLGPSSGSNTFYVTNNSGTGVYLSTGATSWAAVSDERTKDIIEPIENAAAKVATLRAVIGKYKTDDEGVRRSFLIAQDVQAVFPEAVCVQDDELQTLGVQYTDTIPLLVAAIQEQQALIQDLTTRLEALEAK